MNEWAHEDSMVVDHVMGAFFLVRRNLFERLQRVGLPGEIGLSALAGIGMALSLVERANRRVSSFFLIQSGKYQSMITQLSDENRRRLGDFARQVFRIVYT